MSHFCQEWEPYEEQSFEHQLDSDSGNSSWILHAFLNILNPVEDTPFPPNYI